LNFELINKKKHYLNIRIWFFEDDLQSDLKVEVVDETSLEKRSINSTKANEMHDNKGFQE
jgi:hypothetical protein